MTIVGTRPEVIKMSRVIDELDRTTDHVLVHTGQNGDHGLNQVFFDELGIRAPDHTLGVAAATAAQTIANVIARADEVLEAVEPDALVLYGDTNSCLSVIAAKRRRIPVFHLEAGNRCFDQRVPEEVNRKIVDHLSDVNVALSEHARRNLLAEGLPSERVFVLGSAMPEVLSHHAPAIASSSVVERLGLEPGRFLVVSAHRDENIESDRQFAGLLQSLDSLATHWDVPVIVTTHPRTRRRLEETQHRSDDRIRFLDPLGLIDWVRLERDAIAVVSDSGTLAEESSILGFPAVTIRQAHERPEGIDAGSFVMTDLVPDRVVAAVSLVVDQHRRAPERRPINDYEVPDFSQRVVRLVFSYVDHVNRTVWSKSAEG
jgi:UDP-N-acetylglucosamine 2-epimerase (non-hydrolysing)